MTYMQPFVEVSSPEAPTAEVVCSPNPTVLVVDDAEYVGAAFQQVCDFLNVAVERVASDVDLACVLRDYRPMAVVTQLEGRGQDGYHVMMQVAEYDRSLPILLITGDDPALTGAADAVEELWALGSVVKQPRVPGIGAIVDFIFRAGRKGRCLGLMPV